MLAPLKAKFNGWGGFDLAYWDEEWFPRWGLGMGGEEVSSPANNAGGVGQ